MNTYKVSYMRWLCGAPALNTGNWQVRISNNCKCKRTCTCKNVHLNGEPKFETLIPMQAFYYLNVFRITWKENFKIHHYRKEIFVLGNKEYLKMWERFRNISISEYKKLYNVSTFSWQLDLAIIRNPWFISTSGFRRWDFASDVKIFCTLFTRKRNIVYQFFEF